MHIPVLQKEVLQYLESKPNENFIDATFGEGGHSLAILEKICPEGKVLGIEWDRDLYQKSLERKIARLILVNDSYTNLKEIVERENFKRISGILFDLGISSWHLKESTRGFSFLKDEPLDMRYDIQNPLTAEKIVNYWSQSELEKIFVKFGQERFAKSIAENIIQKRKTIKIERTFQLIKIIEVATPDWYHRRKIHFATKTFQALRIAVNDEINNLEKALPKSLEILKPKGKLVIVSFHSLEDKIVKNFFRNNKNLKILTKKPITPTLNEIKINPRSRSAKLRAAIKL